MKFEEFRSLIEERKELAYILDNHINVEDWEIKMNRILERDQTIFSKENIIARYKEIGHWAIYLNSMKSSIYFIFEIGYENVVNMLKKYFKDEAELIFKKYHYKAGEPVEMTIKVKDVKYNLGLYNDILYCLCANCKAEWGLLLRDYPDLKDYLWNEFKELKNAEKRNEMTLIQKRLAKNNEEIDLLITPSKREARISELLDEGTKMQKQIEEISESLEEIDII